HHARGRDSGHQRSLSPGRRARLPDDRHGVVHYARHDGPRPDHPQGAPRSGASRARRSARGTIMKALIVATLLGIVVCLGHALFAMVSGSRDSKQMVNALTWRVALSVALFVMLFVGWHFGLLEPH